VLPQNNQIPLKIDEDSRMFATIEKEHPK